MTQHASPGEAEKVLARRFARTWSWTGPFQNGPKRDALGDFRLPAETYMEANANPASWPGAMRGELRVASIPAQRLIEGLRHGSNQG